MIEGKKILVIIPARGGSKRLPRKNIRVLEGKPLLAWTIEAAQKSKYVDDIVVSTDSKEIAAICEEWGVRPNNLRDPSLAQDTSSVAEVMLSVLEQNSDKWDVVVLLQPTSPLRTNRHIDEALEMFIDLNAESIVSVSPSEHPPYWSNVLPSDGCLKNFVRPAHLRQSQELGAFYRLNGALYIMDKDCFINAKSIVYGEKSFAYIMNQESSVDIDNEIDFLLAELLIRKGYGLCNI